RLRIHVDRVLDPVDRLFERGGDGLRDRLRVRAGVGRTYDDRRRNHLGVLADGQFPQRDRADEEDDDGEDAGEDRAFDEEIGEVHGRRDAGNGDAEPHAVRSACSGPGRGLSAGAFQFAATAGSTIMPAVTRCRPLTMTRSPGPMPSRMTRLPWSTGP